MHGADATLCRVLSPPELRVLEAANRQARSLTGSAQHTVAAAAMDTAGRIYTAVNDFHFTGGPCAELVVLGVAAAAGAGPLMTMVAVGDRGRGVLAPCGRCRQVLLDQQPGCAIIVSTPDGPSSISVRHLLPHAYHDPAVDPERLIRFSAQYYDAVQAGRKTATTRFDDPCRIGPAWLVFEFDNQYRTLPGWVEAVESKRFSELTDEDANREGDWLAADLKNALRTHYPTIGEDDLVDVVQFSVEPAPQ